MADDHVLIRATNQAFWEITRYKPGQRLDMSVADDRKMAKVWLDIYRQIQSHRERATRTADRTRIETGSPYILIVERRDGSLSPQGLPSRGELDVSYTWLLNQPEQYTYLASFDFTRRQDAPVYDQFALLVRRQQAATSGWHGW